MATYTTADDIDRADIAAFYGLDHATLQPLGGGAANSSFKVTGPQGSFVLTVLDNHDLAAGELLAQLHDAPPGRVPGLPAGTRRLSPDHLEAIDEFPDRKFANWLKRGLAKVHARDEGRTEESVICHGAVFPGSLILRPTARWPSATGSSDAGGYLSPRMWMRSNNAAVPFTPSPWRKAAAGPAQLLGAR